MKKKLKPIEVTLH